MFIHMYKIELDDAICDIAVDLLTQNTRVMYACVCVEHAHEWTSEKKMFGVEGLNFSGGQHGLSS